jgi:hypothetical protein
MSHTAHIAAHFYRISATSVELHPNLIQVASNFALIIYLALRPLAQNGR